MKFPTRTKYWVYPYGFSNTALSLIQGLDGKLIRREDSRYSYRGGDIVVNWGSSVCPNVLIGAKVLNSPERVRIATSKLGTFKTLNEANVPTLKWTVNPQEAATFQEKVVARDKDKGSCGEGIVVYRKGEAFKKSHLFYTKYYRKEREFRVHVFQSNVIFVQEKLKKNGEEFDKYIRSHDRGWCFAFKHLVEEPVPPSVLGLGVSAVHAMGLDFGAVDIGWNSKLNATVFEINTAPGLEETSLAVYIKTIKNVG